MGGSTTGLHLGFSFCFAVMSSAVCALHEASAADRGISDKVKGDHSVFPISPVSNGAVEDSLSGS